MGEEVKVQVEEGVKTEEKRTEEESKSQGAAAPPSPCPSPFVLFVDLHCVGCAKKIERSIINIRGVEGVVVDMAQNQVTIKGIVEPQAICAKIMKKIKRRAKVLSPLPAAEGEPLPQLVASQVCEPTTVELDVNMHCEACSQQLKTKILKMRGVQTVATELSSGRVTVTGTMDANKLVDYVYRRTKKQAKILPQPEDQEKPPAAAASAPAPEEKEEEKKEENNDEEKKEEQGKPPEQKEEKETNMKEQGPEGEQNNNNNIIQIEANKQLQEELVDNLSFHEEENNNTKRSASMMYGYYNYQVMERIPPPPQLFSDENPNACCIS
ncbi:hypothetical protein HS088_TW08G00005 [Tripterygium wilfordii]|uniref:HMA domain-containing protein n=1 Tax=Tripterygium wilfordii TaxID=458696 RepID=A0A7J7DAW3_TRIWF|nr:heavy metal-associated isoprenylated plant protein 9 [Tripterygium wilfordii]KAF5743424.1 hypothetical protein HS088_TW08G00005 [Tripterygium wilfordii]